jgi:hypothetical protein
MAPGPILRKKILVLLLQLRRQLGIEQRFRLILPLSDAPRAYLPANRLTGINNYLT